MSSSVLSAVELCYIGAAQPTRALLYLVQSNCFHCVYCSAQMCSSVKSAVELWCWSANACSSVLSAVELCSPCGDGQPTRALLYRVQWRGLLRVVRVSSRVLFCTEFSGEVFSVWCWSANACSSVPSAVELFSPRVLVSHERAFL